MTARRRADPTSEGGTRAATVRFTFDGPAYDGVEGEPLAVALLAADRLILSRSFRFHRPRGLMCSTGSCGWCECEVDGVPSVRSCRVPVRDGLVARGEHALPSVEHDLLSLVGAFSRWIPPTFYHHRFLRPRRSRKRYLDVLRWFGGRGRLRTDHEPLGASAAGGRHDTSVETDVLVVGGGRAGLLAALGAADAGAAVVLIEAEPVLGRTRVEAGPDHVPWSIERLAAAAESAGVRTLTGVAAVGWYDGVVAALGDDVALEIRARAVIAATGSYDRVPLVPGADRPGVIAARTASWLIDRHGVLPGRRALLVGSGQELATAGERLARAGAQTNHDPIPTAALVAVRGRRRVTGATIDIDGRRSRVSADLIVFGDRSPTLDLVLAAGAAVERHDLTLVPVIDATGRTTVPSLFVAGSAAGRPTLGQAEADQARMVGRAAAATRPDPEATGAAHASHAPHGPIDGGAAGDAIVCFCEDVRVWEVAAELAAGYNDPELVKRRTGALTGPCQGKSCLQAFACLAGSSPVPTARPPLRPVRLGDLVRAEPATQLGPEASG